MIPVPATIFHACCGGLQHLYINPELRQAVFAELEKIIPDTIDKNNGRPGMDLCRILVFGTLRLVINCDFDRLIELANEHGKLRQMLGHGPYHEYRYRLQTLQDNLTHFGSSPFYAGSPR